MGINGEQLVGEDGEFKLSDDGSLNLFNEDNDSCCCDAVDPPDPPDPPVFGPCETQHEFPNSVAFSLGAGWSSSEIFWLPRLDKSTGYWRPIDGSFPEQQSGAVLYAANIGATKSGDDPFAIQRWYLRDSSWRHYQGNVDVELSQVPLGMLRDGVTYQMRVEVQIIDGLIQVIMNICNAYGSHFYWPYSVISSFHISNRYWGYDAYQSKSWKLITHPEGTYDFGFDDELTHFLNLVTLEEGGETSTPEAGFIPDTWACKVSVPRLDYEPTRPHGNPIDRGGYSRCRQPYHAQLGENSLRKTITFSGLDGVPPDFHSWLGTDAYDGPEYNGIDPLVKYNIDPSHWQTTYISQAGYSGNSSTYPITAVYYDSEGKATSTTKDWRAHCYIQQFDAPYDIREELNFEFKLYSRNFQYERQDGSGDPFSPEMVRKVQTRWPISYAGVRFENYSLQLRRWIGRQNGLSNKQQSYCRFEKPQSLGGDSLLEQFNVGGDFLELSYAPEGEYRVSVNVKWIDREWPIDGASWSGFDWYDIWEVQLKVNGVPVAPFRFNKYNGTLFHHAWHFEVWGDNINSQYPENPTPLLNFEPSDLIPDSVTNASNSNDAFNTGIYDFTFSTQSTFKQTNFAGNFPPYHPDFHYVNEDEDQEFDLELETGKSYTFPIINVQEFKNSNRRFRAYVIVTRNNGEEAIDVDNGFAIDRLTGTITWTPTIGFRGFVFVEGVSGWDQLHKVGLLVSITDVGGGGPQF
tara:strand:- start:3407 stop:5638 length:2232 start_codon:yes stop_codon:yes gene_type:complete